MPKPTESGPPTDPSESDLAELDNIVRVVGREPGAADLIAIWHDLSAAVDAYRMQAALPSPDAIRKDLAAIDQLARRLVTAMGDPAVRQILEEALERHDVESGVGGRRSATRANDELIASLKDLRRASRSARDAISVARRPAALAQTLVGVLVPIAQKHLQLSDIVGHHGGEGVGVMVDFVEGVLRLFRVDQVTKRSTIGTYIKRERPPRLP